MTAALEPASRVTGEYPEAAGYPRARRPRIVVTEPRRYLAIDGTAAPGGPEFEASMQALYGAAYALTFVLRDRGVDAHVEPSGALWSRTSGQDGWSVGEEAFDPTAWRWTLLMPIHPEATFADVDAAIRRVARRRSSSALLGRLEVFDLDEGLVVEAMHVGPYSAEPDTLEAMRQIAVAAGLDAHGPHHEIYLGDPRRTAPERLRTVLRQPVRPAPL